MPFPPPFRSHSSPSPQWPRWAALSRSEIHSSYFTLISILNHLNVKREPNERPSNEFTWIWTLAAVRLLPIFFHRFMRRRCQWSAWKLPFYIEQYPVHIHFPSILCCYFMLRFHQWTLTPPCRVHKMCVVCNVYANCVTLAHTRETQTNTILFSICFPNWFAFSILVGIVIIIILSSLLRFCVGCCFDWAFLCALLGVRQL